MSRPVRKVPEIGAMFLEILLTDEEDDLLFGRDGL